MLLATGWTVATPQFLPQAKMQVDSHYPLQRKAPPPGGAFLLCKKLKNVRGLFWCMRICIL
jgi:hypothetical protein